MKCIRGLIWLGLNSEVWTVFILQGLSRPASPARVPDPTQCIRVNHSYFKFISCIVLLFEQLCSARLRPWTEPGSTMDDHGWSQAAPWTTMDGARQHLGRPWTEPGIDDHGRRQAAPWTTMHGRSQAALWTTMDGARQHHGRPWTEPSNTMDDHGRSQAARHLKYCQRNK